MESIFEELKQEVFLEFLIDVQLQVAIKECIKVEEQLFETLHIEVIQVFRILHISSSYMALKII